jgi:hypothetical protein
MAIVIRTSLIAPCCAIACCFGCDDLSPQGGPEFGTSRQALSIGTARWEQKTLSSPPARMGHALVYDAAQAVTIAAGGRPVSDAGSSLSDTWAWDGRSWASLAAGMPARGFITATYDSVRGISATYGGLDRPGASPLFLAQILERGSGAWSLRSGFPGARSGAALAYDLARAVTLLFGGFDGDRWRNELWQWNGSDWDELCEAAPCDQLLPSVREDSVFVYDPARHVTLLFGGFGDGALLGETWIWNGSTWSQRLPPVSPSARHGCAAAYDPSTERIFVFGGVSADGETNELWAWDGTTWELVTQGSGPAARRDARLAWDTARKRAVLFGGRSGDGAVDFWELSLTGNGCISDDDCHADTCIEGLCGGPPPEPELDAGSGGGSSEAGSGGAAGASGSGEPVASEGSESGGSGSSDAGATPPSRDPSGPTEPSSPAVASHAPDATSFYACSSVRVANSSSGHGLVTLVVLFVFRRRRPSTITR